MSSVESVSFGVYNKVGSRDESKDINGTAHFLEHMAFKGTTTRSATEIVETIDRVGGSINAATGKDVTKYTVDLLAEDLNIGVDIIADILQNSTFKTKEFEKERSVILEEISMNNDNPSQTNLSSKVRFTATDTVTEEVITLVGDEVLLNVESD